MQWEMVRRLDTALVKCGARLCVLTLEADDIRERTIRSRSQGWNDYLRKFGATEEAIVRNLLRGFVPMLVETAQAPIVTF